MIKSEIKIAIACIGFAVVFYIGLSVARQFALSIAQDNHNAVIEENASSEAERIKRQQEADAAADAAHSKVLEIDIEEDKTQSLSASENA